VIVSAIGAESKKEERDMNERPLTFIGIIVAVLAGVFQLASLIPNLIPFLVIASIILIGLGVVTGR
jgi:hypothetical protein